MNNVINLLEYKKELDRKESQHKLAESMLNELIDSHKPDSKIVSRRQFDHAFLKLLDIFIKEKRPQMFHEFDIWLDDIEKS